MAVKTSSEGPIRRGNGVKVQDYTFVSGDLTVDEQNDPSIVSPKLKAYKAVKSSTTSLLTDFQPEEVFKVLINELDDKNTTYSVSPQRWRINYTKKKTFASSLDEEDLQSFEEMAKIQIDLFDAGDGKICVYFSRQGGASMLFYDQFNKLKEAIANLGD